MNIDSRLIPGKFAELLLITAKQFSTWLKKNLSSLDKSWWDSLVLSTLSYQQKQWVDRKNISDIEGFDLAALLRILDQNWYRFAQQFNFSTLTLSSSEDIKKIKDEETVPRHTKMSNADINVGSIVALNSDLSKKGVIVEIEGQLGANGSHSIRFVGTYSLDLKPILEN